VTHFRERLTPSVGIWLAVGILVPAITLILAPISLWLCLLAAVVLYGGAMVSLVATAPVIEVTDGVLRAGPGRIDRSYLGAAQAYRGEEAIRRRGPLLDARAFRVMRGWVSPVVTVEVNDPRDSVPYWIISTRRPEELVAALRASQPAQQ